MGFIPLACKTQGSLGISQTTAKDLAGFCVKYNMQSVGLCDVGNLSQSISYYQAMKKVDKKPIFGIQLRVCGKQASVHEDNPTEKRLILIAKNKKGWEQLLLISYESSHPALFDNGGRLSVIETCKYITDDLIVIASSDLSLEELNHLKNASKNLWCGINPIEGLTKNELNLKVVPITPNYYLDPGGFEINKTLLSDSLGVKITDLDAHPALQNTNYCIQGRTLKSKWGFSDNEIENTGKIFEEIDEFSILNEPALPNFDCPDGHSQDEFLRRKCWEGFKRLNITQGLKYIEQIKHELEVIKENGMAGYFLVMSDITDFCRRENILTGYGRGSAGGCLISYTTGITRVDPIKHNLLFERFYSSDRGGLPDIDLDIQPSRRDDIVKYICDKYGEDRFMQISTFGTLKGRAAIRCALRVLNHPVELQDEISKTLPEEARIDAQLAEQESMYGNKSVILYSLLHNKKFSKWCELEVINGQFNFSGPLAKEFKLGVEINSIIKSRGRHASAFVLGEKPLHKTIPVTRDDKNKAYILDPEMNSCEKAGGVKLDLLGLTLLDKYKHATEKIRAQKI